MPHISHTKQAAPRPTSTISPVAWASPLLDLIGAIFAQKWVVLALVLAGGFIGAVRLSRLPPVYKASAVAVLLPREKPVLDVAIDTSSVETSGDRAGRSLSGNLMLPPNPSLYTTLIVSRPVLSRLADKFGHRMDIELSPRDRSDEVVQRIRSMLKVTSTEEGLITVTVSCAEAALAADIANELFQECEKASKSIERQLILQQASHLDQALVSSRARLRETEARLGAFSEDFGLVDLDLQTSNRLRSMREQTTEIDQLEADLRELALSHAEKSPEIQRLRARKAALEGQLMANRGGIVGSVSTGEFGQMTIVYESLQQQIRFERDLVATLATKADIYRLRAEEPTGNLAIIRAATEPDRPAGPSKKRELGLALGLSAILGIAWALGVWQIQRVLDHEELRERVRATVSELSPRLAKCLPKPRKHPEVAQA